jgi:hypothetical protein
MPPDPTRISMGLRTEDGEHKLVVRLPGNNVLVGRPLSEKRLKQDREHLIEILAEFRNSYQASKSRVLDSEMLRDSLGRLRSFSTNLLMDLFDRKEYLELRNSLALLLRNGLDRLVSQEYPVGLIEYESNLEQFVPLDCLLIPYGIANWQPEGRSGSVVSLGQVLGFAFIVQRNVRGSAPVGGTIEFSDKLGIDIYADGRLEAVEQEIGFFESGNLAHFDASVQWPSTYGQDAARVLVSRLVSRRNTQFHHYACHCNTEDEDAWKHCLDFALAEGQNRVQLPLQNLRNVLGQLLSEQDTRVSNRTVTFLNACGSAVVSPFNRGSFADLFLEWFGHAGFIGAEYDLPEAFASEFARVFYANLLKFGHLGLALFRTRWFFAKKYNNPLGLFYSLYADPDLRLSRTVNSVNL